ncbi:WASH complex subunit homolog 1-like [Penaeus indicus]|uniref:WASH complex subunit homolog 1-like n=1 Tax=Penaeus indicus TaxID=29960 RepID=UPI00300D4223
MISKPTLRTLITLILPVPSCPLALCPLPPLPPATSPPATLPPTISPPATLPPAPCHLAPCPPRASGRRPNTSSEMSLYISKDCARIVLFSRGTGGGGAHMRSYVLLYSHAQGANMCTRTETYKPHHSDLAVGFRIRRVRVQQNA